MKQRQLWMIIGVVLLTIGFASAQRYTTIDAPGAGTGAGQGTFPQNITDLGLIFGYYVDSNSVAHGFLRSREGNYTTFDVSGAGTGAGQGTFPYSINPAVTITGQYIDSSNVIHGFIRTADGNVTKFDAPGAGNGAGEGTLSYNINPSGEVAGYYWDAADVAHVFLRYRDGSFLTYEGPGAGTGAGQGTGTSAGIGLNPEGAVAGAIIDDNNVLHGYFRKPDGTFVVIDAPGAGTGPGQGTDTDGVSASYFVSGLVYGFEWRFARLRSLR